MELGVLSMRSPWAGVWLCGALSACAGGTQSPAEQPSREPPPAIASSQPPEPSTASATPDDSPPSASEAAPEPAAVRPSTDRPADAQKKVAEPKPAPLPEGTTVLHIGDSFAGALGIELNRAFKEAGVRGILKYQTSTYIPTWAWSKDLDTYLWSFHPDLVLVTLGANELEVPDPTQRIPAIQRLVKRIGDRPCVWVAPPLWQGARDALLSVLRDNVAPCVYLDSSEIVPDLERARDGIHPSMSARKIWARKMFDWLARHRSPTPDRPWTILGDRPQERADRPAGQASK
jgi:lysophospholipase L1-like esterase